jgi:hypothetical protein
MVTREFGLAPEVALTWRAGTTWNEGAPFDRSVIQQAQSILHSTGVVAEELPLPALVDPIS